MPEARELFCCRLQVCQLEVLHPLGSFDLQLCIKPHQQLVQGLQGLPLLAWKCLPDKSGDGAFQPMHDSTL